MSKIGKQRKQNLIFQGTNPTQNIIENLIILKKKWTTTTTVHNLKEKLNIDR